MNGDTSHEAAEILHVELSPSDIGVLQSDEENSSQHEIDGNLSISIKGEPHCESSTVSHEVNDKTLKGMVFMVPPLLAVRQFANHERISISIDEIRRRIGPPESLSQALILGLLKLNKERAKQLRQALSQFGILDLPGRPAVVSSFTKLSESEACTIAEDYFFLASRFMNIKPMNHSLVVAHGGPAAFESKAENTRRILLQVLAEVQARSEHMDLLTHGFSSYIIRAVFEILIELISYKDGPSNR